MSDEKDLLIASRKPSDLLPQPTAEELQFLDIVYEGSVDKLVAWLQLHQVRSPAIPTFTYAALSAFIFTPPPVGMAEYCDKCVSLSVSLSVSFCICLSASISPELRVRSSPNFCACYQ